MGPREMRRLRNGEFYSLYRSTNTVKVINFRILRWKSRVARMEEGRDAFKMLTCKFTVKRR